MFIQDRLIKDCFVHCIGLGLIPGMLAPFAENRLSREASLERNGTKLTVDITNELKFCFWGAKSRKSISFGLLYSLCLSCLQKDHLYTMLNFGSADFLPRIATLSIWPVPSTSFGPHGLICNVCMRVWVWWSMWTWTWRWLVEVVVGKEMDEKVNEEVEILWYVELKEVQIVKEVDRIDWCWISFLQHMPP